MTTTTKARPILFSGPMVNAILEGRKTQTRRVVKPQPVKRACGILAEPDDWIWPHKGAPHWRTVSNRQNGPVGYASESPYGQPGDHLWVRETWVELLHTSPATDEPLLCPGDKLIEHATRTPEGRWHYDGKVIAYRATSSVEFCDGDGFSGEYADKDDMPRWRSPIHMPRWASRITLEVTDVRVERLLSITEEDAISEGALLVDNPDYDPDDPGEDDPQTHRAGFLESWDRINAKRGFPYHTNPWVWVVEFKRVEA